MIIITFAWTTKKHHHTSQPTHRISPSARRRKGQDFKQQEINISAEHYNVSWVHNSWKKNSKPDKISTNTGTSKRYKLAVELSVPFTGYCTGTKGNFKTSLDKCGEKEDDQVVKKAEFHVAAKLLKSLAWDSIICYRITSIVRHDGSSFIWWIKMKNIINKATNQSMCSILQ